MKKLKGILPVILFVAISVNVFIGCGSKEEIAKDDTIITKQDTISEEQMQMYKERISLYIDSINNKKYNEDILFKICGDKTKATLNRIAKDMKGEDVVVKFNNIEYLEPTKKNSEILGDDKEYTVLQVGAEKQINDILYHSIIEFYFDSDDKEGKIQYAKESVNQYNDNLKNEETIGLINEIVPIVKKYTINRYDTSKFDQSFDDSMNGEIYELMKSKDDNSGIAKEEEGENGEVFKREVENVEVVSCSFSTELRYLNDETGEFEDINLSEYNTDYVAFVSLLIKIKDNSIMDSYSDDRSHYITKECVFSRENKEWKYSGDNIVNNFSGLMEQKDTEWHAYNIGRELKVEEAKTIQDKINNMPVDGNEIQFESYKINSVSPKLDIDVLLKSKLDYKCSLNAKSTIEVILKDDTNLEIPIGRAIDLNANEGQFTRLQLDNSNIPSAESIKSISLKDYSWNFKYNDIFLIK